MCQVHQGEEAFGGPACRQGPQKDTLPLWHTSLPSPQSSCQMPPHSPLLGHHTDRGIGLLISPARAKLRFTKFDTHICKLRSHLFIHVRDNCCHFLVSRTGFLALTVVGYCCGLNLPERYPQVVTSDPCQHGLIWVIPAGLERLLQ